MSPKARRDGHNVRVTRTRRARPAQTARAPVTRAPVTPALVTTVLAAALLLSGCGGASKDEPQAKPSTDLPTGNVQVPDEVTLTEGGSALRFRETATVAYEPNTQRSSVLEMSVDSVQQGRITDFAAYPLDAATKSSRPYYVRFRAKNVGSGDLSRAAVPLFAVNDTNALVQPSSFGNTFAKCPSRPLPDGFAPGESFKGCLAYLIPDDGTLTAMSFRPLQDFEPITWEGKVLPPVKTKAEKLAAKKAAVKKARTKKSGAAQGTP